MSSITYTAIDRGNLATGHTAGLVYSIDFGAMELLPTRKSFKNESMSLDGSKESILLRVENYWQVNSGLVTQSNLELWEEFFESVLNNETFTFDAYGTSGSPDNAVSVTMEQSDSISHSGKVRYQYTFTVKVS